MVVFCLLSSAVLLGHVGQSLLLLGVLILLPTLLLLLLTFLLLLFISTGDSVSRRAAVSLIACAVESYREPGLPLLFSLCSDPVLFCSLSSTLLL